MGVSRTDVRETGGRTWLMSCQAIGYVVKLSKQLLSRAPWHIVLPQLYSTHTGEQHPSSIAKESQQNKELETGECQSLYYRSFGTYQTHRTTSFASPVLHPSCRALRREEVTFYNLSSMWRVHSVVLRLKTSIDIHASCSPFLIRLDLLLQSTYSFLCRCTRIIKMAAGFSVSREPATVLWTCMVKWVFVSLL